MKLAIALFTLLFSSTAAFTVRSPSTSTFSLRSSSTDDALDNFRPMFPEADPPTETIQGGETLRTFKMPPDAERAQMFLSTNGRPLKARVELWIGPIRRTHFMVIDNHDGSQTPFRATLRFKKVAPVIRVTTTGSQEFPIQCAVSVPSNDRNEELNKITETTWEICPKTLIQGGSVEGGGGAVRSFFIDESVDKVQVLFWTKDSGKKSFKQDIEILQGPNNKRQSYNLQCGGGTQPYHAVFETPGSGWQIRIINKKFVEDGLTECVVVPYTVNGEPANLPEDADLITFMNVQDRSSTRLLGNSPTSGPDRSWWQ